jgi:hypothetical protein
VKQDFDDTITASVRSGSLPTEPDCDDTVILPARRHSRFVQPYVGPAAAPALSSVQRPIRMPTHVTAQSNTAQRAPMPNSTAEISALYYSVQLDGGPNAHNLECPCVFGRDPRPPRVVRGAGPRLIAVTSPTREVSETHVEVRQLGSSVIVTDLRSTNGSLVQVPGNAARKLRQGESVVVTAGTLVDIGDGNIIRILPRRRLE